MEREVLEFDVQFVGAGPAGLAGAIHLADLVARHDAKVAAGAPGEKLGEVSIAVLEKGRSAGAHGISGAVLDPRALDALVPGWRGQGCPVAAPVASDDVYFLWESGQFRLPFLPPMLQNHGNVIVSLGRLVGWMAAIAEEKGVLLVTETAAVEPLLEDGRLAGVRTGDKGVDKHRQRQAQLPARRRLPGEGDGAVRGAARHAGQGARDLARAHGRPQPAGLLDRRQGGLGAAGRARRAPAASSTPWAGRCPTDTLGGGFLYGMDDSHWALGLVTGLDSPDPVNDPHANFQRWKTHPLLRPLLAGGKPVAYGAKAIPEGGWWAMPKLSADGLLLAGDSGGFLNGARLKGIHLAIKSGMLAAETLFECLLAKDFAKERLAKYEERVAHSWGADELRSVRNFHQGFDAGLYSGMLSAGVQMLLGGRDLFGDRLKSAPGHERMRPLRERHPGGKPAPPKFDGTLTFDKLADVYLSGTKHDEDQPVHLVVTDPAVCAGKCREEFGNPCQHFCPASVYEMVPDEAKPDALRLQINASNCVHCKTCDIADPYQVITWVPPEGGDGPDYKDL